MNFSHIKFDVSGRIATISFNRPEAANAFTDEMLSEIRQAVDHVNSLADVGAVILTGEGKVFCAGGDVKAMLERASGNWTQRQLWDRLRHNAYATARKLREVEAPLIAAINGSAVGAGFSVALLADMRVSSDKAKFGMVFGKRGLIPDCGGTYSLPRVVGISKAMELITTCRIITAEEALAMGAVDKVVPHEKLMESVHALCEEILQNSPSANKEAKKMLYQNLVCEFDVAMESESCLQAVCQLSEDHKEGVRAFVEKREPVFSKK